MKIEEHVPFARITTFKVGGSVRYVLTIESSEDLPAAVGFAKEKQLPLVPLGGGSNMLGQDGVVDLVLVTLGTRGSIERTETGLKVGAGVAWDHVVERAVTEGLWGIENLTAIPGTMGGAVVQNIGAYGAVLSDVVVSVDAFDTKTFSRITLTKDQCNFGYRTSVFKEEHDRYIVLCATLVLSHEPRPVLEYKDVRERFEDTKPTLKEIRDAVTQIRAGKFPSLSEYGTAGSFFLNPVLSEENATRVQEKYPALPVFVLPEGGVKVPLAWLFDKVLALKGVRDGAVEVWREQALVIAAHPGATATEVRMFAKKISDLACTELGIEILPEVRFL